MQPSRRKFLSGVGIFGTIVAGAVAPVAVHIHEKNKDTKPEDISHLAPESSSTLMLTADNRTAEEKYKNNPYKDSPFMVGGIDHKETNRVSMSVGKDDRLWIKIGDQWRRVALDPWCDPTYCDPAQV